jgi:tetratricopeptide (TPR) repeat protein
MKQSARTFLTLALLASAVFWRTGTVSAAGDMATAKTLYASASYEEALAQLDSIDRVDDQDQVEEYKALCLLALGRTGDAEHALERMVTSRPLFRMDSSDVSPKLLEMYRDVRRRILPVAARELYVKGKASFDAKNYSTASAEFNQLLSVVNDAKDGGDSEGLADLKELGEGFLRLTQAQLTATAPAQRAAAAPVAPVVTPAPPPVQTIFTLSDSDVTAPVPVSTALPRWVPSNTVLAQLTFKGVLEVVVDERGAVESATLREPITPLYDAALLNAAKRWTFHPATKDGKPVRFMKTMQVVLRPPS